MNKILVLFLCALLGLGCGDPSTISHADDPVDLPDGGLNPDVNIPPPSQPATIRLAALAFEADSLLHSGATPFTTRLRATFSDSTVRVQNAWELEGRLGCDLVLASSQPQVAQMQARGLVVPWQNGYTTLSLRCGSFAATAQLLVTGVFGSIPPNVPSNPPPSTPPPTNNPPPNQPPPGPTQPAEAVQALTVVTDLTDWQVGERRPLNANVVLNTGTVRNASVNYLSPGGAARALQWQSSNPQIISIQNGVATLAGYGTASITVNDGPVSAAVSAHVHAVAENPASADQVYLGANDAVTFTPGMNGGFGSQFLPGILQGEPEISGTHVVSLGGGGAIVIELTGYVIVDAPGPDFTVFENPITGANGYFIERAEVSVSDDGINFHAFPCDANDPLRVFEGCAGVTPINFGVDYLDPSVSGGDSYDLAELPLEVARYVRIRDMDTCRQGDPTYPLCAFIAKQGFDLDALAIVNGQNE